MLVGIPLVHAEQIAREDCRLVAAGAGANFKDHVAIIHRVLGQQCRADFLFERSASGFEGALHRTGDGTHFGIGRGVVDQAIKIGEFGGNPAVGFDPVCHRAELGKFARELDVGLGRQRARQLSFDRRVACEQSVKLSYREHVSGPIFCFR